MLSVDSRKTIIWILDDDIYDTEYHKQVTFNYNSMMS